MGIGKRLVKNAGAALAAHRRLLVSARRHADRRLLADRRTAQGPVAARHRRRLSWPRMMARRPPIPERGRRSAPRRASCATPSATRRWRSASTPWASRPRSCARRAARSGSERLAAFVDAGFSGRHGMARRSRRGARRSATALARTHQTVVSVGVELWRWRAIRATVLAERERGRRLGLCAGPRLSRCDEDPVEGAGPLHLGYLPARSQGLRRYRAADGEARCAASGPWLQQGKHTNLVSRQFGSWLFLGELLLSVELPADAPEKTIAASAAPASTSARPMPFLRLRARCTALHLLSHHRA